jgi:hypothetical protein
MPGSITPTPSCSSAILLVAQTPTPRLPPATAEAPAPDPCCNGIQLNYNL